MTARYNMGHVPPSALDVSRFLCFTLHALEQFESKKQWRQFETPPKPNKQATHIYLAYGSYSLAFAFP